MQLVEQHIIDRNDPRCAVIDAALYILRQSYIFSGRRVKRGLYRASGMQYINADVNGAYNIMHKGKPDAFAKGVAGYVVHSLMLAV